MAEKAVAPYLRADLEALGISHAATAERLAALEIKVAGLVESVASMSTSQPEVLNAIASTGGTARTLARAIEAGDAAVRAEMRPHIDAIALVMRRIETVRMEMMHEARYGSHAANGAKVEPRIVNPAKVAAGPLRLNLGAGHLTPPEYINVDMRELPGIDVVATADDLPFDPGSVAEIFSSHVVEHFPDEQLRRSLLPYWVTMLPTAARSARSSRTSRR